MTIKHSKYGTSELLDLVLSNQPAPPVEKVASAEVSYEATGDLTNDIIALADGLRARGFVAQAEALEEKLFVREAAKKKVEKAQKAEKTVLDEAHPDGDVEVAKSQSGMGKVWTEQSAKQEILKKVLKTPTGKYASMGAAVGLLASKMAIQFGAYLSEAMDRHLPEGGSADDIVDAVEGHLAEVLVEQTRGYPASLVNEVAEEFISRASRESDELAQRMAADSKKFENYDFDQAYLILAAELLVKAAVAKENDYSKEGTTASSKLDDILKEAGQVLGLTKTSSYVEASDKDEYLDLVVKEFQKALNDYLWSASGVGGTTWGEVLGPNIKDAIKSRAHHAYESSGAGQETLELLRRRLNQKVDKEMDSLVANKIVQKAFNRNKIVHRPNNEDKMESYWPGWALGEFNIALFDAKKSLNKQKEKNKQPAKKSTKNFSKLSSQAKRAVKIYLKNYAPHMKVVSNKLLELANLFKQLYVGSDDSRARHFVSLIPKYQEAAKAAKFKAGWASGLLESEAGVKKLNEYFEKTNNFPSIPNVRKWTTQVAQIAGIPGQYSPKELSLKIDSYINNHSQKRDENQVTASDVSKIKKLADTSDPNDPNYVPPKGDASGKPAKSPGGAGGTRPRMASWPKGTVGNMQQLLQNLSKELKVWATKHKSLTPHSTNLFAQVGQLGPTGADNDWGSKTESALESAEKVRKELIRSHKGYEKILDTAIQPNNKSALATNIQILEALIKVANGTGPGEFVGYGKGGGAGADDAIEIMIDNTSVSLEEKDLANLSTLFNALSLQGAPFSGLSTGISPTKPMTGGRVIKTEL